MKQEKELVPDDLIEYLQELVLINAEELGTNISDKNERHEKIKNIIGIK